jgi:hypothetical protein
MSMFGRGNWSVFGLEPDSLVDFLTNLAVDLQALKASQVMASVVTKLHEISTVGINPFGSPRLDEDLRDTSAIAGLSSFLAGIEKQETVPLDLGSVKGLLPSQESLSLGNKGYGFWAVLNGPKDVTDPTSKKEDLAYKNMGRPFRFLGKKEKEAVEQQVNASAVMARKQFPVLLDFQHGRTYAEVTSKDDILALRKLLDGLGAKTFSLLWSFGGYSWPSDFLNDVSRSTRYANDMRSRADELAQLHRGEIDKLEDREVEKIVSSFFAFTPFGNGLVAALGCPAQICIHKASDPVGVASPSVAFSLLGMTQDSGVAGASLTIVDPVVKKTKGGGERIVNVPRLSVDVGTNVNNFDAGAALLRGLDLPQFKHHVKAALKAHGGLEIRDYWALWLDDLHDAVLSVSDCIMHTLELDGGRGCYGLTTFESDADINEVTV